MNDTVQQHMFELSSDALDELKDILQEEFDDKWDKIWDNLDDVRKLMNDSNALAQAQQATVSTAFNKLLNFYGIDSVTQSGLSNIAGYASGTKNVDKDKIAWTQENGRELIVRKSDGAILQPLNKGDGVIPNNLTENLFNWGTNTPQEFANNILDKIPAVPLAGNSNSTIEQHYGSLINVEGNVDSTVVTDLKRFASEFYEGSYKYSMEKLARNARKSNGIKV